jgi:hypothetical protein
MSYGLENKHVYTETIANSNRGTVLSVWYLLNNELVVKQSPAIKNVSTEGEVIVEIRHQATTGGDKNTLGRLYV